jgi:outer membrane immunogenic protein
MKANYKFARSSAAAFGLIALGMVPTFAADAVMEEPPAPAPVETAPAGGWAGPYAGVALGYGFAGRTKVGDPANKIDTDGFVGNAFGGYQLENGGFVYGAEGDVGYSGVKGDNAGVESKSGMEGSLRGRLGVAVTPDILVYGTAGGAAQSVKLSDAQGNDRETLLGWTAGAGADVKLTQQVFGRAEYRYTDFGSDNYHLSGKTVEADSRDNRVTLGVGVKF